MKPITDCQLYTFDDTGYLHDRAPDEVARQLCAGDSDLIQLRAKGLGLVELRRLAERLLTITDRAGVGLVINDHPSVARELGAPWCHLGQEDFFAAGHTHVSEVSSPPLPLRIGLSTHAPAQAERAIAAGANYIAVGPVFPTGTKPEARPVTLDYVRWASANVTIPWFAIGGINLDKLDSVLAAGARRVCVVSAILCAPDITRACQQFKNRLSSLG